MAKVSAPSSLTLASRSKLKTTGSNATRLGGFVPGVVYGHGQAPLAVTIATKILEDIVVAKAVSHVFDAQIDGAKDSVMIKSIERHPISRKALSVDFQRVGKNETVHRAVPVHAIGTSEGEKNEGGVRDVVLHEVTISGAADTLPDHVDIDVTKMHVGDHVSAAEVVLPKGVHMDTDGSAILVSVEASKTAQVVAEDEAAAPTPEPAVPVVGDEAASAAE